MDLVLPNSTSGTWVAQNSMRYKVHFTPDPHRPFTRTASRVRSRPFGSDGFLVRLVLGPAVRFPLWLPHTRAKSPNVDVTVENGAHVHTVANQDEITGLAESARKGE